MCEISNSPTSLKCQLTWNGILYECTALLLAIWALTLTLGSHHFPQGTTDLSTAVNGE